MSMGTAQSACNTSAGEREARHPEFGGWSARHHHTEETHDKATEPLSHMDDVDLPPKPLAPGHRQQAGAIDFATVVGIIDDGCPFAHSNLSDWSGRTRVRYLWDQGATVAASVASPAWIRPNGFPNGLETRPAQSDNACFECRSMPTQRGNGVRRRNTP